MLEELESIDYLVSFDDDTPLGLIEQILPDVLVKGADYAKTEVVGWEIVAEAAMRTGEDALQAADRRPQHLGGYSAHS